MGDIVEMILDGILCEVCGVVIDGECVEYPRICDSCKDEE